MFNDELQAAIATSILTMIATSIGYYMHVRVDAKKQRLHTIERIHEARFRLVVDLFDLSHAGGVEAESLYVSARERYRDLLLVVEKNCQLERGHCLHGAARAFKSQILDVHRRDQFESNSKMAKQVRQTADEFNEAVNTVYPGFSASHY